MKLERQPREHESGVKLGGIPTEDGYADVRDASWGLWVREMFIRAALVAALSMISIFAATVAEASSVSSVIQVKAVVLAYAVMDILKQPAELVVTDADVRRGYVELVAASRVKFKSNDPKGSVVSFAKRNDHLFRETTVRLMGKDIKLGLGGGFVHLPVKGTTMITIGYRFVLADGTRPGTYKWPITMSVSPR